MRGLLTCADQRPPPLPLLQLQFFYSCRTSLSRFPRCVTTQQGVQCSDGSFSPQAIGHLLTRHQGGISYSSCPRLSRCTTPCSSRSGGILLSLTSHAHASLCSVASTHLSFLLSFIFVSFLLVFSELLPLAQPLHDPKHELAAAHGGAGLREPSQHGGQDHGAVQGHARLGGAAHLMEPVRERAKHVGQLTAERLKKCIQQKAKIITTINSC